MRSLLARYRDFYGSNPLHLLIILAGFALVGYLVATFEPTVFWNSKVWWQSIAVWLAAAVILHDLVLYPASALADRVLLSIPAVRPRQGGRQSPVPAVNYIRIPTLASTLLLVVFLPGIIQQGARTHLAATGLTQEPYLPRWLLLTAAFFGTSAVLYAIQRVRVHRQTAVEPATASGAGSAER